MDQKTEIGSRIRLIRKTQKIALTQKNFGLKIGLKSNSISDLEKGKTMIQDQTVNNICQKFHVNKDWLLFGEGVMYETELEGDPYAAAAAELSEDKFIQNMLIDYWHMPLEERDNFKKLLLKMSTWVTERDVVK